MDRLCTCMVLCTRLAGAHELQKELVHVSAYIITLVSQHS